MDARELLAVAEAVCDDAERMFLAGVGSSPAAMKGPGDFATEVDLAIEAYLRRMLIQLTGIPVLGEEAGGRYSHDAVWIVDPIDGTANFAAGNPMCAILVSLLVDDQPVVAITSMPLLGNRLTAHDGGPVRLNGRPIAPLGEADHFVTQVGFSSVASQVRSQFPSLLRQGLLAELSATYLRPRITGSVGVDLAFTAQGIFGGAVSFSPHVWDNAAGVMLVRANGGVVTDIEGNEWTPRSIGVVAGTKRAHQAIMSTMDAILHS